MRQFTAVFQTIGLDERHTVDRRAIIGTDRDVLVRHIMAAIQPVLNDGPDDWVRDVRQSFARVAEGRANDVHVYRFIDVGGTRRVWMVEVDLFEAIVLG